MFPGIMELMTLTVGVFADFVSECGLEPPGKLLSVKTELDKVFFDDVAI